MSWSLIRAVYGYTPELDAAAKAVLLALAYHANREGVAWPSLRVLQIDTGLSDRTIRRALERLAVDNHVEVIPNPGRPSSYLVTPVTVTGPTPVTVTATPVTVTATPVTVTGGRGTGHEQVKNAGPSGSASRPAGPANGNSGPVVPGPFSTSTGQTWTELPDGTVIRATS